MNRALKETIKTFSRVIPDKPMLKLKYRYHVGCKLNLENPKTYNEKIQWIKLHDRRPEYTGYADKYAVREHIAKIIGEQYLVPLLGVYDRVEDIDWDALPDQFVLKCTHGSSFDIICADKKKLDIEATKKKLNKWMRQNFFWYGREWAYKNIKPRIVCEKYMVDESGTQLKDYKIFCFNGEPKLVMVDFDRFIEHKENIYDLQWNFINVLFHLPNDPNVKFERPDKLEEMLELSKIISKGFYHLRVDFYYTGGRVYFGEMTFYHAAGYGRFEPKEFGELMGSWIQLP